MVAVYVFSVLLCALLLWCSTATASEMPHVLRLRGMGGVMSKLERAMAHVRDGDPLVTTEVGPGQSLQSKTMALRGEQDCSTKLYCAWFCPFAQSTWVYMEELADRGFRYQYIEIDPYAPRPDGLYSKQKISIEEKAAKYPQFVKASPSGLIPAVDHDGVYASTCTECCEYLVNVLDRLQGAEPGSCDIGCMMPESSSLRAKVWAFWNFCQNQIVPWFYRALMLQDEEDQSAALSFMLKGLRTANKAMLDHSSTGFFLGSRFSVADLALAPWWERLPLLQHYRRFQVPDTDEYARLADWWEAVQQRPTYRRTMAETHSLIANYREYAEGTATSTVARSLAR